MASATDTVATLIYEVDDSDAKRQYVVKKKIGLASHKFNLKCQWCNATKSTWRLK